MDAEIDILLGLLDEAFERKAWHGPNLRGAIRGLSAREAGWRPAPGRHSIQDVVVHAAYWKYAVRRRLTGERRGSFARQGSNWFRSSGAQPDDAAWREDVELLVSEHRKLREAVTALRASDLRKRSRGSRQTNLTLVRGIAAHDLYHAGQIQLLKRLQGR
jgi:uncharacterized damage-inducible protein DinB